MSKGSVPRPFSVSNTEYANRWDAIFGRDDAQANEKKNVEANQPDHARDIGGGDNPGASAGQAQAS
jgi:hypothetical protein